jgi:hypothetical protein
MRVYVLCWRDEHGYSEGHGIECIFLDEEAADEAKELMEKRQPEYEWRVEMYRVIP